MQHAGGVVVIIVIVVVAKIQLLHPRFNQSEGEGGELSAACWLVAAAGLIVTPTPYGMLQTQHLPYCHHPHAELVLIVLMMEMMWITTPSHSADDRADDGDDVDSNPLP